MLIYSSYLCSFDLIYIYINDIWHRAKYTQNKRVESDHESCMIDGWPDPFC